MAYLAADGHIHELFVPFGGSWSHADLTQIAGAPPPAIDSPIAGYEWKAGSAKQVVYLTADGHIHELFVPVGGSWSHADLTDLAKSTNAPPAASNTPIAAFAWEAGGTKQVVYLTADGHIHELFVPVGGSWSHADLTDLAKGTNAPPVSNNAPIAAFAWEAGRTKQVAYPADDGHIHELFVPVGGSWSHADLTDLAKNTGAPATGFEAPIAAYAWEGGGTKQVVYVAPDGGLHELFVPVGGSWSHAQLADVNIFSPAPPPTPDTPVAGYGWAAGGTKQVVYLMDETIRELFFPFGASWSPADLTRIAGAPSTAFNSPIAGYEWGAGSTKQVVYLTGDGHIHELFVPVGGSWSPADLTDSAKIAGAPPARGYP